MLPGLPSISSPVISEEDSSLRNNLKGNYLFHRPQQDVQIIPYDNGYYAETKVNGFSEFWINGGGSKQDHPLAAWLKDFTAVQQGNGALLKWRSWQETATSRFVVEKSGDSIRFRLLRFGNGASAYGFHSILPVYRSAIAGWQ